METYVQTYVETYVETKAYRGDFPGFNMLHYVVKQLLEQCPTLTLGPDCNLRQGAGGMKIAQLHST